MDGEDPNANAGQDQQPPFELPAFNFAGRELGPILDLIGFSIRNGTLETARSLLVRPTVSPCWFWRPIEGLAPGDALSCMTAFVRMYMAQMVATVPDGYSVDQARKAGIILGIARCVITALYDISDGDLIVGERAAPWMKFVGRHNGISYVGAAVGVPPDVAPLLSAVLDLSATEKAAVAAVHMSAIGILPLQGYSLSVCGHHYLSDPGTQSYRAFEVVERTHWTSTLVTTWFTTDMDRVRDVLWHKVGHPVSMSVKRKLAFSTAVPKMLIEAGAGSAASRLPAMEPELRAANSHMTLFQTVRPLLEMYGGGVNYSLLTKAVDAVQLFSAEEPSLVDEDSRSEIMPQWVNSRNTAVKWLGQLLERNKDTAALCFGFYTALSDQNTVMTAGAAVDTLRTSFSLSKLRTQSFAAFIAGQQAHGDYVAARTSIREKGDFQGPGLTFT